ncbi:hypothetical protein SDRG_07124 [Saprolegnia diclina VS20]|uniref:Uncharacterized protein n=1 Tax=Saprolegnia diclina (strain VS20) TaxID=1156394 RepID=T0QC03_SAPDV|nr:hypothetical protein SDRG_07124 [Saprolegnia diclina VS20]EQC35414.1 hypothetical protein SDRG_07124 [Saprolegnia diclina VS20]|eukprot:XP_008611164.1 hypothetical protein SDRG_07124 [Saprolegnia diclina VS20]
MLVRSRRVKELIQLHKTEKRRPSVTWTRETSFSFSMRKPRRLNASVVPRDVATTATRRPSAAIAPLVLQDVEDL